MAIRNYKKFLKKILILLFLSKHPYFRDNFFESQAIW